MLCQKLFACALVSIALAAVPISSVGAEEIPYLKEVKPLSTASADLLAQQPSSTNAGVLPDEDLGNLVIIEADPQARPEPKLFINLESFVLGDTNFTRSNLAVPQAFVTGSVGLSAFPKLDNSTRWILSANYGLNRSLVTTKDFSATAFGTNALTLVGGVVHSYGNNLNLAFTYTHLRFFAEVANQDILTDNIFQFFLDKSVPLDKLFTFSVVLNPALHVSSSDNFSRFELSLQPRLTAQWTPGFSTTLGYRISYSRYFNSFINTKDPNFINAVIQNTPLPLVGRDDFRNQVSLENGLEIFPGVKLRLDLYYIFSSSTLPVSNFNEALVIFGLSAGIPVY
jgi:hypothetical protein